MRRKFLAQLPQQEREVYLEKLKEGIQAMPQNSPFRRPLLDTITRGFPARLAALDFGVSLKTIYRATEDSVNMLESVAYHLNTTKVRITFDQR